MVCLSRAGLPAVGISPERSRDVPALGVAWASLDFDRRGAVIDTLVQVTILPARRGRRPGWRPGEPYFNPASVQVTPKRPDPYQAM
jgi:hypothetical protein